jgi:hypothetical protein
MLAHEVLGSFDLFFFLLFFFGVQLPGAKADGEPGTRSLIFL